jgi:uncharacterized protein (TIGR03083 family)
MDSDTVWQYIDSERAWMADFLESLSAKEWQQPSLCPGWTVRDVGAHVTFAQSPVRDLLWPALRAGFRYDVLVRDTALRSPLTHEEIVARLRSFLGSRRRVAFITDLEPLIDILVHNQDIARPLGIDHPIPPDAAAAAADRVLGTPAPIRRWRPPVDVRLVATDIDWSSGNGREIQATMGTQLLTLTGRLPIPRGSSTLA